MNKESGNKRNLFEIYMENRDAIKGILAENGIEELTEYQLDMFLKKVFAAIDETVEFVGRWSAAYIEFVQKMVNSIKEMSDDEFDGLMDKLDPEQKKIAWRMRTVPELNVCPKCGKRYERLLAVSRDDNKTMICDFCGMMEALESLQLGVMI